MIYFPFLDVFVERCSQFITSIYRKPPITSQYLCWNFFSPQKCETKLLLTLTHRVLAICSEKLRSKLDDIKFMLQPNGYLEHVIESFMAKRISNFTLCLNLDGKDAPSIYISHGSVLFLPGLKSNENLLSNSAFSCGTTRCLVY